MQTQPENLTKLSFENYSTHFGFAKNLSSLSERRSIFPFVADELKFVVYFFPLQPIWFHNDIWWKLSYFAPKITCVAGLHLLTFECFLIFAGIICLLAKQIAFGCICLSISLLSFCMLMHLLLCIYFYLPVT